MAKLKSASYLYIILFIILALPFWIIFLPFYLIIKTIVTIWQPYFYKKDSEQFNEAYQKALSKGIHIDYPPSVGKLFGIGSWGMKDDL